MKLEYIEGPEALEKFNKMMIQVFRAPKASTPFAKPKAKPKKQAEPRRLLSNADVPGNLIAADAVLAGCYHPRGHHPFVESTRGVLHNCANLEAELPLAPIALPDAPFLHKRVGLRSAAWAKDYAIRPAKAKRILESAVGIAEVDDGLLECVRAIHNDSNVCSLFAGVRYVVTLTSHRSNPS